MIDTKGFDTEPELNVSVRKQWKDKSSAWSAFTVKAGEQGAEWLRNWSAHDIMRYSCWWMSVLCTCVSVYWIIQCSWWGRGAGVTWPEATLTAADPVSLQRHESHGNTLDDLTVSSLDLSAGCCAEHLNLLKMFHIHMQRKYILTLDILKQYILLFIFHCFTLLSDRSRYIHTSIFNCIPKAGSRGQ